MNHVRLPLPEVDFDVLEVAVSWKPTQAGHRVTSATGRGGTVPAAEPGDAVRLLESGLRA